MPTAAIATTAALALASDDREVLLLMMWIVQVAGIGGFVLLLLAIFVSLARNNQRGR